MIMDENKDKDKLINSDKQASDDLMEDTIVFRREPDTIVSSRPANQQGQQRANPNQTGQNAQRTNQTARNAQRPNPARPQNIPTELQNTARVQGGAVIRPLKPQQPGYRTNTTQSPQQASNQRPTGQGSAQAQNQRPSGQGSTQSQNQRPTGQGNAQAQNQRPSGQAPVRQSPAQNQNPANRQYTGASQNQRPNGNTPTRANIQPIAQNQAQGQRKPDASPLPVVRQPAAKQPVRTTHDDFEIDEATWRKTPPKPPKQTSYVRESATSAIMSAVKAIVYIICVIAVSIPLAIFIINTANDIFAFVKEDKIISVEIPEYATIDEVGDILGDAGVIRYPWAFKLWSKLKEKDTPEFIAGTYEVSTQLNYDYLRSAFKKSTTRSTIRLTIPEGYTVDEIIDLFVSNGIGTKEGFIKAVNEVDYDFRFIDELSVSPDRTYRLEGYLFPDTYDFYTDATEAQVIYKLLDNFNKKFAEEYYARCEQLNMTVDEVITLASMIEKEAKYADEMGDVSAVFHNRLKSPATFPCLESDATIMYAIHHDTGSREDTLTGEDTKYDSPYNTYTHKGLPPGPIANPGMNSIRYALYPNDSNYYFFVSNSRGRMLFAETYAEHQKNIVIARSE